MGLRIRRGSDEARASTSLEQGEIVWTSSQGTTGANYHQLWVGTGIGTGGVNILETSAGFGLTWDAETQRLEVSGLTADDVANGVNNKYFTSELAVDAVAAALVAGNATNVGITFTYSNTQDDANRINATVALDGIGITNVVEDTTPQLGGDLDLNTHDITGTGNIDITGTITVTGDIVSADNITFTGEVSNGNLVIFNDTIYSSTFATNPKIRLDTQFNLIGRSVNTGDGNETTAGFNIFVSSATDSKVLEDGPLYSELVKAHNGTGFVDSAGFAFVTSGTITTGASSVPSSLLVFLGNGTDDLASGPGQFSFNNTGSFVAPVLQTGVYTTTPTDGRPTGVKGMIIFNDTSGKFQGYNGTTWVDLN